MATFSTVGCRCTPPMVSSLSSYSIMLVRELRFMKLPRSWFVASCPCMNTAVCCLAVPGQYLSAGNHSDSHHLPHIQPPEHLGSSFSNNDYFHSFL